MLKIISESIIYMLISHNMVQKKIIYGLNSVIKIMICMKY